MIDNRTNRDVWIHGCQHVDAGRVDDAKRCFKDLLSRVVLGSLVGPEAEFYLSHLDYCIIHASYRHLFSTW